MKKIAATCLGLFLLAGLASAQGQFEFSLSGGYNLMRQEMTSSYYGLTENFVLLRKMTSTTSIAGTPAGSPYAGLSIAFFPRYPLARYTPIGSMAPPESSRAC